MSPEVVVLVLVFSLCIPVLGSLKTCQGLHVCDTLKFVYSHSHLPSEGVWKWGVRSRRWSPFDGFTFLPKGFIPLSISQPCKDMERDANVLSIKKDFSDITVASTSILGFPA